LQSARQAGMEIIAVGQSPLIHITISKLNKFLSIRMCGVGVSTCAGKKEKPQGD